MTPLLSAGVPDDKARRAAEAMATHEPQFARIRSDLHLLKWQRPIRDAGPGDLVVASGACQGWRAARLACSGLDTRPADRWRNAGAPSPSEGEQAPRSAIQVHKGLGRLMTGGPAQGRMPWQNGSCPPTPARTDPQDPGGASVGLGRCRGELSSGASGQDYPPAGPVWPHPQDAPSAFAGALVPLRLGLTSRFRLHRLSKSPYHVESLPEIGDRRCQLGLFLGPDLGDARPRRQLALLGRRFREGLARHGA